MKYSIILREGEIRNFDCVVVPVYSDAENQNSVNGRLVEKIFSISLSRIKKEESFKGLDSEELLLRITATDLTARLLLIGMGKKDRSNAVLLKRRMLRAGLGVRARGYRNPAVLLPEHFLCEWENGVESALVGFGMGVLAPIRHKSLRDKEPVKIKEIGIYCSQKDDKKLREVIKKVEIMVPIISRVRELVDEPANLLGPGEMASNIIDLVKGPDVRTKIYNLKSLKDGFPLVYEVGKGSSRLPVLLEIEYRPHEKAKGKKRPRKVCLVGKGIVFDSGGLNLKPFHSMSGMKNDMAGAASVAGAIAIASRLGLGININGILPIAENIPSANSYRPGDILKSRSGKTVEVISTDAEGRLILSDALSYASEKKPDYLIDMATLTGACIVALGNYVAGLFSNDDKLAKMIEDSSAEAGEMLWRLPLIEEMVALLKSDIADIRNSLSDAYGGAIGGALFLREFVKDVPWAHLDIAGPAYFDRRNELGPRGATGFGVHTMARFLQKLSTK